MPKPSGGGAADPAPYRPASTARRAASHMASTGGSVPVQAVNWAAAWWTSIPSPPTTLAPLARAAASRA